MIVLPVEGAVYLERYLRPAKKTVRLEDYGKYRDFTKSLMPKSPTKIYGLLVRGRKSQKLKDEEMLGDNLV